MLNRDKIFDSSHSVYVIAEVGSNFDGSLHRAKKLAKLAKEVGADGFKIQNFQAPKIVSKKGFSDLQISFQSKWKKPVYEVYKNAEFPRAWLREISDYCNMIGIDFLASPYDYEAVDLLEKIGICAYKIGSGEIDHLPYLEYISKTNKPIILSCGASTLDEIKLAVDTIRKNGNNKIVLLQCVTNYPSFIENANVLAMKTLKEKFGVVVGYSDHSIGKKGGGNDPLNGITIPLAAVSLGAKVIEKHFTDDRFRNGPDHPFAMEPKDFKRMVAGIRAVEKALGDGHKKVLPSESETVIIQRRGLYTTCDILPGEKITEEKYTLLRPAIGLRPLEIELLDKSVASRHIKAGEVIRKEDLVVVRA